MAIPGGTYYGTFQRKTLNGGQISNVSFSFSGNTWTGQSEFSKYPALCYGTWAATGLDSVHFENTCAWTAEFDWTLILSHAYKIKMEGRSIELTRDYGNNYTDIYKLVKQ